MRLSPAPRAIARGATVALALTILIGAGQTKPRSHVVDIAGFQFAPAEITVAVGDTVTWSNHDIVPHTATAMDGAWDSGTLEGKARRSVVVRAKGKVDYQCALHPSMTGTVVVR